MPRQILTGVLSNSNDDLGRNTSVVFQGGLDTTASTYAPGCVAEDQTSGLNYQNTGTYAAPVWTPMAVGRKVISGQGATRTLLASESGAVCIFDRAAGIVFTLPTAPAIGTTFEFHVLTTITSGSAKVITGAGTELMVGGILSDDTDSSDAIAYFPAVAASSYIAVLMDGITHGGLVGSHFKVTCLSATRWMVEGVACGTGSVATPFSAS